MKIITIVGARPNFMKIAPLIGKINKLENFESLLLHTGQHYDEKMSDLFFNQLNIPKPDIYLEVGSDTHAKQTAKIMEKFDDVCIKEKPDIIIVVGDVNSTLACSLVASKYGIKIIHLEAGLRSYDRNMPEEINRIITDSLSDYLLTPSKDAEENLLKEGITKNIFFVGNIMIDTLKQFLPVIEKSQILSSLNLKKNEYILVTLHRPSNVDNKDVLKRILETLKIIQNDTKIIFPLHPRTSNNIKKFNLELLKESMENTHFIAPLGYLDFQKLMINSKLIITDSGGIQEETTWLKKPCITLRENTERPVTVEIGSNELIGNDMDKLLTLSQQINNNKWKKSEIPGLWDGETSDRIIEFLKNL